jgi:hypothetical protein
MHCNTCKPTDAFHAPAAHVARELLVPEHRQALFERELEPIAARHAVAGPVVKVLVRDDALDGAVVHVGRRRGRRQHKPAVEKVQRLVLHRAHVEIVHGDDVEQVEVVL